MALAMANIEVRVSDIRSRGIFIPARLADQFQVHQEPREAGCYWRDHL